VLLTLYLTVLAVGIAVLAIRRKSVTDIWNVTCVVVCSLVPILINILVSVVYPVFVPRYLFFLMPYWTVFSAVGIVYLLTIQNFSLVRLVAGGLLVTIVWMSMASSVDYLDLYRKEDWRAVADLLSTECMAPDDLRMFVTTGVEVDALYYNPEVGNNLVGWNRFLKTDPSPDAFREFIPDQYKRACLVESHIHSWEREYVANLRSVLLERYSKVELYAHHGVNVEIFDR
jgi:hypothetical protein